MNTFLFYDIETSGLNKAFDQVLQFAAIRTDTELRELERHEIHICLSPDVIPAPAAILTHHIDIHNMPSAIDENAAISQIHRLLNIPGTISIGYNSLGFDDEFLRFSFYRNLLPPYTHQYANECGRADLYPLLIMYYLYKNEIIIWPKINNKLSLKLENINGANQFVTGKAHNAMIDVLITLELAKKLKTDPEMWNYVVGYFNKTTAQQRITKLETVILNQQAHHQGLIIDGSFGVDQSFLCPVLALGTHHHYKNKTLWLRLDRSELPEVNSDAIADKTWVFGKKINETGFLLPFSERFNRHLNSERLNIYHSNLQWLQKNTELWQSIIHYHREYTYPKIPDLDTDAALYENGFLSEQEQYLCRQFHLTPIEKKWQLLERFNNPILRQQGIRVLGRHYPDYLPEHFRDEYQFYLRRINPSNNESPLVDYRGQKRLTPQTALLQIAELRKNKTLNATEEKLLNDLESYLRKNFSYNNTKIATKI